MTDKETFYERLDRIERENRIKRLFADRPDNLHDYQGCAKDAAKEKVLKVWPNATAKVFRSGRWLIYDPRERGNFRLSSFCETEEAAWQNAAESLPAQPKFKCGTCGEPVSIYGNIWLHEKASQNHNVVPVPVESLLAQPGQEHPRADCEGCNKLDCPCNSECGGGEPCWRNPETGYMEYCPKHEAIVADKAMEVDATCKAKSVEPDGIGWCSSCDSIHEIKRPTCSNCGDWLIFASDDLREDKCIGFPKCGVGDKSTSAHEKHCPAYVSSVESIPVEAKEKEQCVNCGLDIEQRLWGSTIAWIHVHNNRKWCEADRCAEPKPTPSTPADSILPKETLEVILAAQNVISMFTSGLHPTEAQLHRLEGAIYAAQNHPQPDSSSISTDQTFEEWWNEGIHLAKIYIANGDYWQIKGIAEQSWNASKETE